MKRLKVDILLLVLASLFLTAWSSPPPDYTALEKRFLAAPFDTESLQALRADLDDELVSHPGDDRLLRLRISVNRALRDDAAADEDVYRLGDLFPESPYYVLAKCELMETRKGYSDEALRCYAGIMRLYEKKFTVEELRRRHEYILVALLAEAPNAEMMREGYIKECNSDPALGSETLLRRYAKRKAKQKENVRPDALLKRKHTVE